MRRNRSRSSVSRHNTWVILTYYLKWIGLREESVGIDIEGVYLEVIDEAVENRGLTG